MTIMSHKNILLSVTICWDKYAFCTELWKTVRDKDKHYLNIFAMNILFNNNINSDSK